MSGPWDVDEVDFSKDREGYLKLNDNEKHFVKYVSAFFAYSDAVVNNNIGERFSYPNEKKDFKLVKVIIEGKKITLDINQHSYDDIHRNGSIIQSLYNQAD